jgi:hypothetical protein
MSQQRQFWMIWNPEGNMPRFCHDTEAAAETEAERLARLNPGQSFYILEAVQRYRVDSLQRMHLRPQQPEFADDIPF